MLAIRYQRTGRKGHTQFRIILQYSRLSPSSGRTIALVGSYDPHTKKSTLNKEIASKFLANGAQPSDRVARLFKNEGIELPSWVKISTAKTRTTRHGEKLRKNQPVVAEEPVVAADTAEVTPEITVDEELTDNTKPVEVVEAPADQASEEAK